ncbi:MAG: hypothetical protein HY657_04655 [Acidobacteria bacterium]|nr:hypothetical protein [Acidobacteriota bacterium]
MMDRSISALRTLRPGRDDTIFWYRDDLHQPYPISPMGATTVQKHHAWGYHVAADQTKLPPSNGAHVKIHKGRIYLGFVLIDDQAVIAERARSFGALVEHCRDHWDEYYRKYIDEVRSGLDAMNSVDGDRLSTADLLAHLERSEAINRRNWEIHFILMYPADTLYMEFEAFCKGYGVPEKDFVSLLKGFDSMPARTDEELWRLALAATERGLKPIVADTPSAALLDVLRATPAAADWLTRFREFLAVHGNRITAAHLDVIFPTWKEDPAPVLDTIKSYFQRMDDGWDYEQARREVNRQRDAAIAAFEQKVKPEDREQYRRMLNVGQQVYAYQEDHGFYIDQGSTAALHAVLMSCGRRLQRLGLLRAADDVFFLTYHDLVEVLSDLAKNEKIATYHHGALVPGLVEERRASWIEARTADAPLTLGNVPETMTDPLAVKVFGIIDDVLHPKGEKQIAERLEGFPGAPGVVEGPARVIMDFADFPLVQSGEILVCPYTGTAWTPLFLKIAGVVTDTGGMLTHAAIAAREYGIPAVVGTWNATNSIRTGDLVRVDGERGVVEVVQRASASAYA